MGCRRFQRQIEGWVGGDLDERSIAHLRVHLKNCTPCAEVYQSALRAREALRSATSDSEVAAENSLWPQLRVACARALPRRNRWRGWAPAASLAAACLAVLVLVELSPPEPGSPSTKFVVASSQERGQVVQGREKNSPWLIDDVLRDTGRTQAWDLIQRQFLLDEAHLVSDVKRGHF